MVQFSDPLDLYGKIISTKGKGDYQSYEVSTGNREQLLKREEVYKTSSINLK